MVREVALHRAAEKARDADTLDKRAVERVPVPDDLEGCTFRLLDTLRVKHAVKEVFVEFYGSGTWLPLSEVEPMSLTWPEVVHVLISDEPGGNVLSVSRIELDELSTTEKAFNLEFQNPDNVSTMHQALSCIMRGGMAMLRLLAFSSLVVGGRAGWYANCGRRIQGNNYWEDVQEQTEKFLAVLSRKDGLTKIQQSKQITWATWEIEAHTEFVRFWPNSLMKNAQKLEYVFVFDEARHLVRNDDQLNCFLPIRRATRAVGGCGIVVLFIDTSSEISNFSAPDLADPSDRVTAGNVKLASPIWGTFSADISGKDSLQLFSAKTLNSIASRIGAVRYGRPLWWATFRSHLPYLRKGEEYSEHAKLCAFEVTRRLAQDKLLGGSGK
ncbi:hypothetical protein GOP47_0006173 [Adiantum capillus-veneris]|uniref:Uncharacterized protein n=1 Tax=Adiantum capillus-veneris TaxID=13818 RepID=A0A9D4ZLS6_ADICA|nr:hypothetical protein GOP47_0006173 [Adiantum capillus-veneris]